MLAAPQTQLRRSAAAAVNSPAALRRRNQGRHRARPGARARWTRRNPGIFVAKKSRFDPGEKPGDSENPDLTPEKTPAGYCPFEPGFRVDEKLIVFKINLKFILQKFTYFANYVVHKSWMIPLKAINFSRQSLKDGIVFITG